MNQYKTRIAVILLLILILISIIPAAASDIPETETLTEGVPLIEENNSSDRSQAAMNIDLQDGEYSIQVECIGGSGKAGVSSPTLLIVENGKAYARLQWSSENYDYMIVAGEKYLNERTDGGNSEFTVPILAIDTPLIYIGDTLAMGTPHEIEYTFTFYSESIGSKDALPQEAAKKVLAIALAIIIGGGILNYFVKKKYSR